MHYLIEQVQYSSSQSLKFAYAYETDFSVQMLRWLRKANGTASNSNTPHRKMTLHGESDTEAKVVLS